MIKKIYSIGLYCFSTFKELLNQALMVQAYNPSYLEHRDQDTHSSKPALGKQFSRPYLKNIHPPKRLAVWLKC
jgi:hypothetical protein